MSYSQGSSGTFATGVRATSTVKELFDGLTEMRTHMTCRNIDVGDPRREAWTTLSKRVVSQSPAATVTKADYLDFQKLVMSMPIDSQTSRNTMVSLVTSAKQLIDESGADTDQWTFLAEETVTVIRSNDTEAIGEGMAKKYNEMLQSAFDAKSGGKV